LQGEEDMDDKEQQIRNEYFDDDAIQNIMSLQQYAKSKGVTIAPEKKKGGPIKLKGGGLARRKRSVARGCGAIMENRRKKTQYI
jgi:hypothetical protein